MSQMKTYLNLNGRSGIACYETTEESIHVVFKTGANQNYLYNAIRPGRVIVDRMKSLAAQGYGLNTYISTAVKGNYFKKW